MVSKKKTPLFPFHVLRRSIKYLYKMLSPHVTLMFILPMSSCFLLKIRMWIKHSVIKIPFFEVCFVSSIVGNIFPSYQQTRICIRLCIPVCQAGTHSKLWKAFHSMILLTESSKKHHLAFSSVSKVLDNFARFCMPFRQLACTFQTKIHTFWKPKQFTYQSSCFCP